MYKSGLVLEGGGSRAIYTSGVLDAFVENGITFPYVIGVSAGSCNGASFLGKNIHRQHDITINYVNDKRYMSLGNMIKKGEYLNGDWIFNELSYDINPLNQDEFENSNSEDLQLLFAVDMLNEGVHVDGMFFIKIIDW